jgi:hypothetical protein
MTLVCRPPIAPAGMRTRRTDPAVSVSGFGFRVVLEFGVWCSV